jgi:hypothetical protein
MFYKKNDKNWYRGLTINLPTGDVLTKDNKLELNGWVWYDEEPQEYLDWKEQMNFESYKLINNI